MTDLYKIDIDNYKVLSKIKSGGFGSVYTVQEKQTKEKYAAKIIDSSDIQSQKYVNREIGIMTRMKHPTIIKFYGYSLTDFYGNKNVTLIMQLATKGSLAELLSRVQKGLTDANYDNTARQKILIGIARGMMYLHQHHAVHRDLKPGNILLDDNLEPHITDFGLSKLINTDDTNNHTQSAGTFIYMAPEVIDIGQYNGKADVYSFGILMYEVVTDLFPYPEIQQQKITTFRLNQKILNENYRPQFTFPVKPKIKELIEQCWSGNPKSRPTFEEIYNRLSRNIEESLYNVFDSNDCQYYLDDVDQEEVLQYVDKIENDDDNTKIDLDKFIQKLNECNSKISQLSIEKDQMKQKILYLEKKNGELVSKVDNLELENDKIKKELFVLKNEKNIHQENEVKQICEENEVKHICEPNEIRIHIKNLKATDLQKIINTQKINPFITVLLKSQHEYDQKETHNISNTMNPIWNDEFDLYTTDSNDILFINMINCHKKNEEVEEEEEEGEEEEVIDRDYLKDKIIDEIQYPLNKLIVDGDSVTEEIEIRKGDQAAGKISFEIQAFKTVKSEIEQICTYCATGNNYKIQKFYRCLTCNLTPINDLGICEACARNCHKGHDIRFCGVDCAFCDCCEKCKCKLMKDAGSLQCTSIETQGKLINQPMFYCLECDPSSMFLICQSCAAKFHHGHNLIYLGVVESKVCQNSKSGTQSI